MTTNSIGENTRAMIEKIWEARKNGNAKIESILEGRIIDANDGLIAKCVHSSKQSGVYGIKDMMQEGRESLLIALRKYVNENEGKKDVPQFSTYVNTYLTGKMIRISRFSAPVQLSQHAIEKRSSIVKLMSAYEEVHRKEMPIEELAQHVDIPVSTARAIIDSFGGTVDLDKPTNDEEGTSLHEIIAAETGDSFGVLNLDEDIINTILVDMEPLEQFLVQIEFGINGYPQMSVREAFVQFPDKMKRTLKDGVTVKPVGLSTAGLKAKQAREYFIDAYRELCGVS